MLLYFTLLALIGCVIIFAYTVKWLIVELIKIKKEGL